MRSIWDESTPEFVWRIGWWFQRKWLRFKWWLLMGGNTDRHPQHYTIWGLILTALLAFTGTALALSTSTTVRAIGFTCLALAIWILLSFFFPLWLPPLWNEERIKLCRGAARDALLARLQNEPPPSPLARAYVENQLRSGRPAPAAMTSPVDFCEETASLKDRGEEILKRLRGQKAAEPFGGVKRLVAGSALAMTANTWLGDVAALVFREAPEADYAAEVVKSPPLGLDALIGSVRQDLTVLTHMRVEAGCQTVADRY